jgi:CBS-domain-containing membrane protein
LVNAAAAMAVMAVAAVCTSQPLIFPSLGPSAFLFFHRPSAPSNAPRTAVLAHGSGLLIGLACFWLCRSLLGADSTVAQVAAAALSLGLISALMVAADLAHAPAASTTLIVSLGLMTGWQQSLAMISAVIFLAAQAYLFNRLCGIHYPLWSPHGDDDGSGLQAAALRVAGQAPRGEVYSKIADQLVSRERIT